MIPAPAREALERLLGSEGLLTGEAERTAYAYDATPYSPEGTGRVLPNAVALPADADQVAALVELARAHRFPLVPRGAGTGMTGGARPEQGGLVITFPRMTRLEIDPDNLMATVEPGVITGELQRAAEAHGLFYPPDPASRDFCTLGGNLAENAGGLRAVKYGVTRDYVLGIEAVLGDGTRFRTGSRAIKSVVGYDLTRLLVGSEGTLGLITEAWLKLLPLPEATATLTASFPTVTAAAATVPALLAARLDPTAIEFLDRAVLEAVADALPFPLTVGTQALLLVELDGGRDDVRRRLPRAAQLCRDQGAEAVESATDDAGREALWQARRSISPAIGRLSSHKLDEDVAVPRAALPALVEGVTALAAEHGLRRACYGHAGDGNLHVNLLPPEGQARIADDQAAVVVEALFRLALSLGGTLSGEHGVGTAKRRFVDLELGTAGIDVARRIKQAFDPEGILNPGKLLPDPEPRG